MLASQGIDLDRSTLAFWVGYAAAELMPLYERLKANLLASAKLAVDETPVPVLDPGRGQTKTGYFWAAAVIKEADEAAPMRLRAMTGPGAEPARRLSSIVMRPGDTAASASHIWPPARKRPWLRSAVRI